MGSLLDFALRDHPPALPPNTGNAGTSTKVSLPGPSLLSGRAISNVADPVGHAMVLSTLVS
ncbi:MAG: hypothetical protein MRJ66_07345 [Nitrospira sp.]|nr:hypothetical protein [Nitrospira sp.]